MKISTFLKSLMVVALTTLSGCGDPSYAEKQEMGIAQVEAALQTPDGLQAVEADITAYEDVGVLGTCDAFDLNGDLVNTETTKPWQPGIPLALPAAVDTDPAPGCQAGSLFCLYVTNYSVYELTDGSPPGSTDPLDWDEVPGMVLTSPVTGWLPIMACDGMPVTPAPVFTFGSDEEVEQTPVSVVEVQLVLDETACDGECTGEVGEVGEDRCVQVGVSDQDCYEQCGANTDCAEDEMCLPMSEEDLDVSPDNPGICVGQLSALP